MNDILNNIMNRVPSIIIAILLAILTWIVAKFVRKLIIKAGKKLKLDAYFTKMHIVKDEEKGKELIKTMGNLGAFIVFMIMIPAVLDRLGMDSVALPISSMAGKALNFIPNIIGAGILLFIGYFIARIVKEIIIGLSQSFGIDNFFNKFKKDNNFKISELLGNIVFAFIFIPVIITALDALKLHAISVPAVMVLESIFSIIPNVLVSVLLVVIGLFIAKIVCQIIDGILKASNIDTFPKNKKPDSFLAKNKLSDIITTAIKYIIITIFVFEAINVLNLAILTEISVAILAYMPNIIAALVILIVAYFAANFVSSLIEKTSNSKLLGVIAKIIIYVFAIFMTLNQLQVASQIVSMAFLFIMGALSLAFVLAVGLGGRDFAKKQLDKLDDKLNK